MRSDAALAGLVVAMLALVPWACEAQVYKCHAGGGTTYQAAPCANAPNAPPYIAAPAASSVSAASVVAPDLHGSVASLRLGLQAAVAEEHELLAQYRQASDEMRNKMMGKRSIEAVREQQFLSAKFTPRIRAAEVRQDQFRQEIVRRCPAGAMPDAQEPGCKQ
jgi:hypothetical protein